MSGKYNEHFRQFYIPNYLSRDGLARIRALASLCEIRTHLGATGIVRGTDNSFWHESKETIDHFIQAILAIIREDEISRPDGIS